MEHLAGLEGLVRLELRQTRITDAATQTLARLKTLKVLDLSQTGVTDDGLKKLRAALPGCDVQQR